MRHNQDDVLTAVFFIDTETAVSLLYVRSSGRSMFNFGFEILDDLHQCCQTLFNVPHLTSEYSTMNTIGSKLRSFCFSEKFAEMVNEVFIINKTLTTVLNECCLDKGRKLSKYIKLIFTILTVFVCVFASIQDGSDGYIERQRASGV